MLTLWPQESEIVGDSVESGVAACVREWVGEGVKTVTVGMRVRAADIDFSGEEEGERELVGQKRAENEEDIETFEEMLTGAIEAVPSTTEVVEARRVRDTIADNVKKGERLPIKIVLEDVRVGVNKVDAEGSKVGEREVTDDELADKVCGGVAVEVVKRVTSDVGEPVVKPKREAETDGVSNTGREGEAGKEEVWVALFSMGVTENGELGDMGDVEGEGVRSEETVITHIPLALTESVLLREALTIALSSEEAEGQEEDEVESLKL